MQTSPGWSDEHVLGNATAESYRQTVIAGVDRVASAVARTAQPFTGVTPATLERMIDRIDLDKPILHVEDALDELEQIYLRDAVYFHHPHYLAHLNCPVAIPALLGEAILSSVNSSLDTWDQSVGGTLIEQRLVSWTAARIGLGAAADGVFTSGGTQSNLQAMLIAREETSRRVRGGGPRSALIPRLRVFASEASHFSIAKSATVLGLAEDAVVSVPCDAEKRMCPSALAFEIDRCRRTGLVPMAVVATAGTTDFGSIDPLPEMADLCAGQGIWLHVDAAYGCGLLVSRRRHLLDGLDRADSVTVDYHKSFFQPVSSSAVLVRDRRTLDHVTHRADYLNPERNAARSLPDQVDKSLQTTRRFDALKLWLSLRIMGADAIGALFDEVVDRAAQAFELLDSDPRFEVVTRPRLSTLVFRYRVPGVEGPDLSDEVNLYARESLFSSGVAVIAGTKVDGRHYLKFTLLNPQTSLDDIAHVLDLIATQADEFLAQRCVLAEGSAV